MKYELLVQKHYWHPTPEMKKLIIWPITIWPGATSEIVVLNADEMIEPLLDKMVGLNNWKFLHEA